jgi:hypothetical protein
MHRFVARKIGLRQFSTIPERKTVQPTPKSGFKMPKLKGEEKIIAFRPHGNTDILNKA